MKASDKLKEIEKLQVPSGNPTYRMFNESDKQFLLDLLRIRTEALETIANDKMNCKEFGLNWEGYCLFAKKALEDSSD